MKSCEKCGMIYDEITGGCPNCARLDSQSSFGGTSWPLLKTWFSSPLTLTLAILVTVVAVLSALGGGIPLFQVLIAIGLWITYAAAKASDTRMSPTGLKMISGTLKAVKIILWVAVGLCAVSAVVILASASSIPAISAYDLFNSPYFSVVPEEYAYLIYNLLSVVTVSAMFTVLGLIVLAIAVVLALFNVFFYRNAHKLAKSVSVSCETGLLRLAKHSTVKAWMIVFAVIQFLTGASGIVYSDGITVIQWLCTIALYVIGFIWMRKYLDPIAAGGAPAQPAAEQGPVYNPPAAEQPAAPQNPPEAFGQVHTPFEAAGLQLGDVADQAAEQFTAPAEQTPDTIPDALDALDQVKDVLADDGESAPAEAADDSEPEDL